MNKEAFELRNAMDFLDQAIDRLQLLHDSFAFANPDRWIMTESTLSGLCLSIDDIILDVLKGLKGAETALDYYSDLLVISGLERDEDLIESGALGLNGNLEKLDELIEKINAFMDTDLPLIKKLRDRFEAKRHEITRQIMRGEKEKRASATLTGPAKAQKADPEKVTPN